MPRSNREFCSLIWICQEPEQNKVIAKIHKSRQCATVPNRKYFRFILYLLLDICRQFYHASTCTHPQRVQDPTSDYSAYLDYQMQVVLTHDQVIKWARMISKLKFPWAVLDLACGWPLLKIAVIPPRRSTASRIASFPNRNSATRKTISER